MVLCNYGDQVEDHIRFEGKIGEKSSDMRMHTHLNNRDGDPCTGPLQKYNVFKTAPAKDQVVYNYTN